jgi:hypothetical protein
VSDLRKFCWGTFLGTVTLAFLNKHGLTGPGPGSPFSPGEAIIASGLMLGCITVMCFGKSGERP